MLYNCNCNIHLRNLKGAYRFSEDILRLHFNINNSSSKIVINMLKYHL